MAEELLRTIERMTSNFSTNAADILAHGSAASGEPPGPATPERMRELVSRLGDASTSPAAIADIHRILAHRDGDKAGEGFKVFFAAFVAGVFEEEQRPASTRAHVEAAFRIPEP